MKEIKIKISSVEEMIKLGSDMTNYMYPNQVLALIGDLGAGKTTFTKGIGETLGVKRVINSPTFTIMKIYEITNHLHNIDKLYHLDVYRLTSSKTDFELEEYFYMGGIAIVEWALIIEDILPPNTWYMNIKIVDETTRIVILKTDSDDLIKDLKERYNEIIY